MIEQRTLTHAVSIELQHSKSDTGALLREAADLIDQLDGTIIGLSYYNSLDGGYHETIAMTIEVEPEVKTTLMPILGEASA